MATQLVGIRHIRDEIEVQPAVGAEMSVVGLIGTAVGANEEAFPLDTNVYFLSTDTDMAAKLGTGGWLVDAVRGINDQIGVGQGAVRIVARRVAAGVSDAATVANILGSSTNGTGIYGFLDAGEDLGFIPRLIVPEMTDYTDGQGIDAIALLTNGDNLTAAPTVVFAGGGSDPGKVLPTAVATLGTGANAEKVVSITITSPGKFLTAPPTISFTGGGSEGDKVLPTASCTIAQLASPIVAALQGVCATLRAHAIFQPPTTSYAAWLNYIESHAGDRLIPAPAQRAKVMEGESIVERDLAPRLAGIMVRRDHEYGGIPGHSSANQPVQGIVGVSRKVRFWLDNPNSEGADIIDKHGSFVARGEAGVESALGEGGFIFWGTDNLSADAAWQFYHVTRMRDFIELTQMKVLRRYLGRENITIQTITAIRNTMVSHLEDLRANGHIIDFEVKFEEDKNSPENLRLGHLTVSFRCEEAPVLRMISIHSRRYRAALARLVSQVSIQLNSVTA